MRTTMLMSGAFALLGLMACGTEEQPSTAQTHEHPFTATVSGTVANGILNTSDPAIIRTRFADTEIVIPFPSDDSAATIAPHVIASDANNAIVEVNGERVALYFPRGIPDASAAYEPSADGTVQQPLVWWGAAAVLMVVGATACGASAYFTCNGAVDDVQIHISTDFCSYTCN